MLSWGDWLEVLSASDYAQMQGVHFKVIHPGSLMQTCMETLAVGRGLSALLNTVVLYGWFCWQYPEETSLPDMVHFMWVKLWARYNCLCLVLLTQQLLNSRKCSFSEWLLLQPENKTWRMYMVLVLSFLYPWFAYTGHFPKMGARYLVIHILSLFNILLIFCGLKQSQLISVSLVDTGTCAQCFLPSPTGCLTEWCIYCRLSRHCSRQALLNLRYLIRSIFIVWCTWCQGTILAKASWYFIVLLHCAFNCCITDSFCVKHKLILGFLCQHWFWGFLYHLFKRLPVHREILHPLST